MAIQSTDIGLALATDVGDVTQLQTQSKQLVGAVNEVLAGAGSPQNQIYVEGENNVIDGIGNIVLGSNNIVTGSDNIVIGDNLIVIGNSKLIIKPSDIGAYSVDISTGQIGYYYYSPESIPLEVGDLVCINLEAYWADANGQNGVTTETGKYVTQITEITDSYILLNELRVPPDSSPTTPNLNGYTIKAFEPIKANRKINGEGSASLGGSCEGDYSASVNLGIATGDYSFAVNKGAVAGNAAFSCNTGNAKGNNSFAANYGQTLSTDCAAFGLGEAYGGKSLAINTARTAGRAIKCTAINCLERSVTAATGENINDLIGTYVLIRYRASYTTIVHQYTKVLNVEGQKIYFTDYIGEGINGEALMADGYIFRVEGTNSSNFAMGWSMAGGNYSQAGGLYAMAVHDGATMCGKYGVSPESYSWALANGASFNAMGLAVKMLQNGNVFADGTFSSPCADYAELFEWDDGNPESEDRVGYFVTLEGEKIKKAGLFEPFVLGIVSGNPAILGDSSELHWNGKYQTDDFGRIVYMDVTVPAVTEGVEITKEDGSKEKQTVVIQEESVQRQPLLNSNWDSTMEYVPRLKRKEWSAVGVLGKLVVYDDGTCEVGGLCQPNEDGKATKAINSGYKVLKRVANDKVLIWFKTC